MYSVKEAAAELGITPRAVTMRCKRDNLKKKGKSYYIPQELLNNWKAEADKEVKRSTDKEASVSLPNDIPIDEDGFYIEHNNNTVTITLTKGKYEELQRLVTEFYYMEEKTQEGQQLVAQLNSMLQEKTKLLQRMMDTIEGSMKTLQQQQYIEAKDKGYDK